MKRHLSALQAESFDLIVIGGGITGASVARDATLRGYKVALIEKGDFGSGTTSASSKLVHGGLRYLANGEFALVRESLRERHIWEKVAPHQVFPLPFLVPTYGWGRRSGWFMSMGLALYDLLSFDRNRIADPEKRLPAFQSISKNQVVDVLEGVQTRGLTGGKVYYDYLMPYPERLCLSVLETAVRHGASVANYVEALRIEGVQAEGENGEGFLTITAKDRYGDGEFKIRARCAVNAGGPWSDFVMEKAGAHPPPRRILRSKGIHLITRSISSNTAAFIQPETGGHFFVIPWRDHSLIGTTDEAFVGDPDDVRVTEDDIERFLKLVRQGLPSLELTREDVLFAYAGLRPLVAPQDGGGDTYTVSRDAEVLDHATVGGPQGLISALGGKWTTSRQLAEDVVDRVQRKLGGGGPCRTKDMPLSSGNMKTFREFVQDAQSRHPSMDPALVDHLARLYGTGLEDVLDIACEAGEETDLMASLGGPGLDIAAQVVYAVRHEMAMTLSDVIFRRTGIGTLGPISPDTLPNIASLMARELGWKEVPDNKKDKLLDLYR